MVRVEWLDAVAESSWVRHNKIHKLKPAFSVTVGLLVQQTPDRVSVAALVNDSHVSEVVTIPKGMVRRMVKLKEAKP